MVKYIIIVLQFVFVAWFKLLCSLGDMLLRLAISGCAVSCTLIVPYNSQRAVGVSVVVVVHAGLTMLRVGRGT